MDPEILEAVLAGLAGLLIGSFLNVCVYRLPRDLSVVRPRSHCPACEKQIDWYDNIPVLSYLMLGAKCRHCGERIPLRYPLVELATAAAFALCVAKLGLTWPAAKFALLSAILITLIATDLEERILPDEFTLGGTVLGIALSGVVPLDPGIASFLLFGTVGQRWLSVVESLTGAFVASGLIWGFAMALWQDSQARRPGAGRRQNDRHAGGVSGAGRSSADSVRGGLCGFPGGRDLHCAPKKTGPLTNCRMGVSSAPRAWRSRCGSTCLARTNRAARNPCKKVRARATICT